MSFVRLAMQEERRKRGGESFEGTDKTNIINALKHIIIIIMTNIHVIGVVLLPMVSVVNLLYPALELTATDTTNKGLLRLGL